MTRDYRIILPLMIAVVISTLAYSFLSTGSIYTLKLIRRGINIESGRAVDIMRHIKVKDVMSSPVEIIYYDDKVGHLIQMMHDSKHNGFPVLNQDQELVGIVTLQDIRSLPTEGIMDMPVPKLMSRKLVTSHPEETLDEVFVKLKKHDIGHLPIVEENNKKQLIGIITRSDVIKAYDKRILCYQ